MQQATVDQFVPQMINYELIGGVNFQKGCYPGQEVVARSQYRGTTKRRAFIVHADQALTPGQELFSEADPGQPAGVVINAATIPGAAPRRQRTGRAEAGRARNRLARRQRRGGARAIGRPTLQPAYRRCQRVKCLRHEADRSDCCNDPKMCQLVNESAHRNGATTHQRAWKAGSMR